MALLGESILSKSLSKRYLLVIYYTTNLYKTGYLDSLNITHGKPYGKFTFTLKVYISIHFFLILISYILKDNVVSPLQPKYYVKMHIASDLIIHFGKLLYDYNLIGSQSWGHSAPLPIIAPFYYLTFLVSMVNSLACGKHKLNREKTDRKCDNVPSIDSPFCVFAQWFIN